MFRAIDEVSNLGETATTSVKMECCAHQFEGNAFVLLLAVTVFPRRMLPSELQRAMLAAMDDFYAWRAQEGFFYKLQLRRIRRSLRPHLAFLEAAERELIARGAYTRRDGSWQLDEERLRAGPGATRRFGEPAAQPPLGNRPGS